MTLQEENDRLMQECMEFLGEFVVGDSSIEHKIETYDAMSDIVERWNKVLFSL